MKLSNIILLVPVGVLAGALAASADVRRSEDVRVLSDFVGTAGGVSQSSGGSSTVEVVAAIGTLGGGVAQNTAATHILKSGFAGSLFEVTALAIEGSPSSIDEITGVSQLSGVATYDDGTTAGVDGADIVWTGNELPVNPVGLTGTFPNTVAEATGSAVYQDSTGSITGFYLDPSISSTALIQVLDTGITDSLPGGGDGLDDGFQIAFFGDPSHPDAAPGADPDGDGNDNSREELTGHDPTKASSVFAMKLLESSSGTADLQINKVMAGRVYTVRRGATPDATNDLVEQFTAVAQESNRPVQDTNAPLLKAFYQTEVSRPAP